MPSWRRLIPLCFAAWLLPFAVAFLVFPAREVARPLFESVMAVAVATTAVLLTLAYFRGRAGSTREGFVVGASFMMASAAIDAPLMLFGGPMQMSLGEYMADIGLTYLIFPVVGLGFGFALKDKRS